MTWVIWNVRGINKRYKQKELKIYVQNKQIKLAVFLETRVKKNRANRVFKNILPGWAIQNNYRNAINGRIWLTWDPKVYCIDVEKIDAQLIHCTVRGRRDGFEACLTLVYGFNTVEQRKALWSNLNDISTQVTKSWIIGGDFNTMLYTQDRMYGNLVAMSEMVDFSDYHKEFGNIVKSIWNKRLAGDDMENVWKKLKALKLLFKRLNADEYKGITKRIENARSDLVTIQQKMQKPI
ncbi:uncharacterized protein [Nicotiana sylvestris]|uniref:uncharacterized protein n=1 Tax=Nicotiana sylvestris TaxID=4096 RepID=UPI00388C727B